MEADLECMELLHHDRQVMERIVLKSRRCMAWAKAIMILVLALVIILTAALGVLRELTPRVVASACN